MADLRKPEDIVSAVTVEHGRTSELRDRFDEDYRLYRLEEFKGVDREDGLDTEEGYEHYTSNEPQTYADKIIAFNIESKMLLRIQHPNQKEEQRKIDDLKEKFMFGILRAADERLVRLFLPRLRAQLAFYSSIRGLLFGRASLVKRADETTFVDITPWDPLNTYWSMNGEGLDWACYKTRATLKELQSLYPDVDLSDLSGGTENEEGYERYDFYDGEINTVVLADRVLKPPTPHGSPRVPVFYNVVGPVPMIQSEETDDTIRDWGESVFKSGRVVYQDYQQQMSIMKELATRSRSNPVVITSPDGTKTLDMNPWLSSTEITLAEGESIEALDLLKSAPDLAPFLAMISGEMQRGALPHTAFGELPFQLSGFAIQTLRQGIETILTPRLRAVEDALLQCCRLISDQYGTGAFDDMELSGYDRDRQYFRETIDPKIIEQGGDIDVRLASILPQDDVQKVVMAQQLREGPVPLAPDRWIREEILNIQDVDSLDAQIKEQMGERMLPEAALWDIMIAMEETGREELAGFYYAQLVELFVQKMQKRAQLGLEPQLGIPPGLLKGVGGSTGGAPGIAPTAQPSQSLGGGASGAQLSNQGGAAGAGVPRPAAQSDANRLNNIGLAGPGG
jgi:hypothetical protein